MSYFHPREKWERNLHLVAAAFQSSLTGVLVVLGAPPVVSLPFAIFHAVLAAQAQRSIRRGHREAEGDRGDHDSGTYATGGTINVSFSGDATRALAALGAAANATSAGVAELPRRTSDEPIRAWKQATIILHCGMPCFAGVTSSGTRYSSDAYAECTAGWRRAIYSGFGSYSGPPTHRMGPVLDCSCGFYAMAEDEKPTEGIVLEVELYGTVIVCERGYRAQRQRVLGVTLPKMCANALCTADACLVAFVDDTLAGLCDEHAALVERTPLHAPGTITDLAGLLGTEVRWAA